LRYFIKCTIELLGRKIKTEFSLTERKGMRYPILLGRKLLNKRFIIDTSLVNVSKQTHK
ncbi:MAG: ATP-dependent zinc protease, partial [Crocinitomicaceae bacterium]